MGATERRQGILRILCRRRHETIKNLSFEFGVSERTILRDIEILSLTEPIYTQCGRYGGGIYVGENFTMDRIYMRNNEIEVLHKLLDFSTNKSVCKLSEEEITTLRTIISQYTKS